MKRPMPVPATLFVMILAGASITAAPASSVLAAEPSTQASAPTTERDAVLAAMQAFFDAMAAKDAQAMRRVLVEDGSFHAMLEADGKTSMRTFPNAGFLRDLPAMTVRMRERMWAPEVRIHGPIATVWAHYDFWMDGKPSHCGMDAFNLVRTAGGWKIAGGIYTVQRDGCDASPLGPLKE